MEGAPSVGVELVVIVMVDFPNGPGRKVLLPWFIRQKIRSLLLLMGF